MKWRTDPIPTAGGFGRGEYLLVILNDEGAGFFEHYTAGDPVVVRCWDDKLKSTLEQQRIEFEWVAKWQPAGWPATPESECPIVASREACGNCHQPPGSRHTPECQTTMAIAAKKRRSSN